ncbi:MAG: hypothetical protein IJY90_01885 [Clostridia bacterium]|nr:hypothetical protein [Clostridia bacterium]
MKNKSLYIVSGLIIAASIAILLVFLLLPQKKTNIIIPLNCTAEDIEMEIGQTKINFYQVSHENAIVSFSVDKSDIIDIDKDKIVALNAGKVTVEMTVTVDDKQVKDVFIVTVLANQYTMKFKVASGGTLTGNTLTLTSKECQFYAHFYDKKGEELTDCQIMTAVSGNATLAYEFGMYKLTASSDCLVTFSVSELNFVATLNVIVE